MLGGLQRSRPDVIRQSLDENFSLLLIGFWGFNLGGFQGEFTMAKELTPRQKQVVRLLSLGCTVREVAKILKLSPSTVDNHKSAAMARLGTDKVALLTRWAIKLGISPLNDRLSEREKRLSGRKNDGWND